MDANNTNKVILQISPFIARVLTRMITDEKTKQSEWKLEDQKNGRDNHRDEVIKELDKLQNQLTAQGFNKFVYYN